MNLENKISGEKNIWNNLAYELYQIDVRKRKKLLGMLLTVIDASISNIEQKKAVKDIVSNTIYSNEIDGFQKEMFDILKGFILAEIGLEAFSKDQKAITKLELDENVSFWKDKFLSDEHSCK